MATLLFAIYFKAANEVLSAVLPVLSTLMFKTEKDFVLSGCNSLRILLWKINVCKWHWYHDKTKLAAIIGRLEMESAKESSTDFLCLVFFVTSDEIILSPRLRQCTFQHQVSDMKLLILVLFYLKVVIHWWSACHSWIQTCWKFLPIISRTIAR